MRPLLLALILLCSLARAGDAAGGNPEAVLRGSEYFVLGVLGRGGGTSRETKALRELLRQPDAAARCEAFIATGSPVLKAYGLAGLKYLGSPKFAVHSRALAQSQEKVPMIRGDVARQISFREFLERLDRDYPHLPPDVTPVIR